MKAIKILCDNEYNTFSATSLYLATPQQRYKNA